MTAKKRYMRIDEVAKRFEVHPRTVKRWWLSGKTCLKVWCPVHLVGSRGLFFLTDSVDEFERTGMVNPEEWEEEEPQDMAAEK